MLALDSYPGTVKERGCLSGRPGGDDCARLVDGIILMAALRVPLLLPVPVLVLVLMLVLVPVELVLGIDYQTLFPYWTRSQSPVEQIPCSSSSSPC